MVLTKDAGTSEIFTEETCTVNPVVCCYETLNGFELQWNPGQIRARYFLTDLLHCSLSQTVTEVFFFPPSKKKWTFVHKAESFQASFSRAEDALLPISPSFPVGGRKANGMSPNKGQWSFVL